MEENLIFLPHCLRSQDCKARLDANGYNCINCGKCEIGGFKKQAEEAGYHVFIVPGASMVKKIVKEHGSAEMIIGVACE